LQEKKTFRRKIKTIFATLLQKFYDAD